MNTRYLFVRRRCIFCRQALSVVNKINLRLPLGKMINIKECYEHEEFGLKNIPLIEKFHKEGLKEGYPFLFIDGIIIEPAPTEEHLRMLIENLIGDDFII